MPEAPIGLRQPTDPARLDNHTREVLRVVARRGHRHWMLWPFGKVGDRCQLRVAIGGAVFGYAAGVLRRMAPDAPDGRGEHINGAAWPILVSKQTAKDHLAGLGIPVPEGRRFAVDAVDAAVAYADSLGMPVCVKPEFGKKGINVSVGLTDPRAVRAAFLRAAAGFGGEGVVVERSVAGEVFRFYYVQPRVVGVKLSRPPSVVGDGVSDLAALIAAKNAERDRRHVVGHLPIVVDADLKAYLDDQGFGLDSVPPAGERVFLRAVSNGAVGADTVTCADALHPSYAAMIERLGAALPDMRVAALDTVVTDRARPASAETFAVLEVNNSPGVLPYLHPWEGEPQDIVTPLVEMLERLAAETSSISRSDGNI